MQVNAPAAETADASLNVVQGVVDGRSSPLLVDRNDLKEFEKVSINFEYADVTVAANAAARRGTLRVQLLKGGSDCKAHVSDTDKVLVIGDKPPAATATAALSAAAKTASRLVVRSTIPNSIKCRYAVELGLRQSAPLFVELTRGSVALENWASQSQLQLEWGDVDVGSIGALDVKCGRCTLAGEGVSGSLRFLMDNGNVGLSGLSGSVDGQTLGDTILKWRRIKPDATVKISSRAGDVVLTFPRGVPLDMQLKAPRGEVSTASHRMATRGIPVTVRADLGNVRLYSAGR